jgi:hypothetical protein
MIAGSGVFDSQFARHGLGRASEAAAAPPRCPHPPYSTTRATQLAADSISILGLTPSDRPGYSDRVTPEKRIAAFVTCSGMTLSRVAAGGRATTPRLPNLLPNRSPSHLSGSSLAPTSRNSWKKFLSPPHQPRRSLTTIRHRTFDPEHLGTGDSFSLEAPTITSPRAVRMRRSRL